MLQVAQGIRRHRRTRTLAGPLSQSRQTRLHGLQLVGEACIRFRQRLLAGLQDCRSPTELVDGLPGPAGMRARFLGRMTLPGGVIRADALLQFGAQPFELGHPVLERLFRSQQLARRGLELMGTLREVRSIPGLPDDTALHVLELCRQFLRSLVPWRTLIGVRCQPGLPLGLPAQQRDLQLEALLCR